MYRRVVQLASSDDVYDVVAEQLLRTILLLQETQDSVHIALAGGATANAMYERFADLAASATLDAPKLHLWWGDERFVPATDPERNSLQAIERLARTVPISSANIHMMAAMDGRKDPHEAAEVYESELGDTIFDIVVLGIGARGNTASLFPNHPSSEPTNRLVIGVENAPVPPTDRISLTLGAINRSASVWFLATGEEKADAVEGALSGVATTPAAQARGTESTLWFIDDAAAANLPEHFHCEF